MLPFAVQPISPALGAIVTGINPFKLSQLTADAVNAALLDHKVLFFRDPAHLPDISEAGSVGHRASAALLGTLHTHPIYPQVPGVPEIIILDTSTKNLPDNDTWHTDVTFIQTPPQAGMLLAVQLPPVGGDTMWCCCITAYNSLSEPMKAFLGGLHAEHNFVKSFPEERYARSGADADAWNTARRKNPPVSHPVVRTHPVTKAKGLFVSEGFTTHILGLKARESDALLTFLYTHMAKPEHTVRWRWQVGDVALWDNRCTAHYALADYLPHRRVMRRATILGERPY